MSRSCIDCSPLSICLLFFVLGGVEVCLGLSSLEGIHGSNNLCQAAFLKLVSSLFSASGGSTDGSGSCLL